MKALLVICLFACHCSFAQIEKLKFGNIMSGFISLTRFDSSRPAIKEQPVTYKGRIIQINVWYPSAGDTKAMRFSDYVRLIGKEIDISLADKNVAQKGTDKYFEWPASTGADKKKFTGFLNKEGPMRAWQNAKRLKQKSPLVILVHGFAADYAYLAEYLTSHGYTVLQVPVKGTTTYELDYEGNGLDTQVKDYEFALKIVEKELSISPEKMAVVGFSFGGQSAVALSLRNKNINAIVSLDGGIGSIFGADLLRRQSYYDAKQVKAPILHFYNPDDTYTELAWFNTVTNTNRYLAAMKNMQHGHFTSFGLLNKIIPGIMGEAAANPGDGYEAILLLTKKFLDQSLTGSPTADKTFFDTQIAIHPWIKYCVANTEIKLVGS